LPAGEALGALKKEVSREPHWSKRGGGPERKAERFVEIK